MKDTDVHIRRVNYKHSVVTLYMTDNTIRRYLMKKIHEYVNQKPSTKMDLEKFHKILNNDRWFFQKPGDEPTSNRLAVRYIRTMKTDLDCPITLLRGSFIFDGSIVPYYGYSLLDGKHRLLKCLITGENTVNAVEVTADELLLHVAEVD